jgi:uncharacterized protein (DUF58 family)
MTVSSLVRASAPPAPGPGPMPEALLRALEITITRRIEGLLAGEHRSASLGLGTELSMVRPYQPGDDVRRIDWKVTARTNQTHVRVEVAERSLTTWLVMDTSASMTFGTADRRKKDVAEGVALAIGHLACRRGGRLGLLGYGDTRPLIRPPRQGRTGLRGVLFDLQRQNGQQQPGPTSLGSALSRLSTLIRRRGLIVIVGDFLGPRDWQGQMSAIAAGHHVIAIEISDPREHHLPDVGDLLLTDPETGDQLRVDTSDRKLRRRYAEASSSRRAEVARILRSISVHHLSLSTSGDWLRPLAGFLRRERRGW